MSIARTTRSVALTIAALSIAVSETARGQLRGHYVPGFTGLQNGTQPPPSISVALPLYFYTTNDFRDDDGRSLAAHPRINSTFIGPAVAWVTNLKILGGNYGGSVIPIDFIRSRIEGHSLDVPGSYQYSDLYAQPLQLGWTTRHADFLAGYGLFIPTGAWQLGRSNGGLGMWSHLPQAGSTVYLDEKRAWSLSSLASYEIHSRKRATDIKVGNILTFEGGLARTFIRAKLEHGQPSPTLIVNAGPVYYAQFKLSNDRAGIATPLLVGKSDRVFAAGLEGDLVIPRKQLALGLRVEPEFAARNRTQGWTVVLSAGYVLRSLVPVPDRPVANDGNGASPKR